MVMGLKQWQWKGVEPEQTEKRVARCHWDVDQHMPIFTIKKQRGHHLEEVQVVLDEKVAHRVAGLLFNLFKEHSKLRAVQVIHCKPLMDGSLECMSDSAKTVA
jgi:hypothetical protein